jgi:hypothetical protein
LTVGVEGNPWTSRNRMWPHCATNRQQFTEWSIEEAVSCNYLASLWKLSLLRWIHWFSSFKLDVTNHKYSPYWLSRSVLLGENYRNITKQTLQESGRCYMISFFLRYITLHTQVKYLTHW